MRRLALLVDHSNPMKIHPAPLTGQNIELMQEAGFCKCYADADYIHSRMTGPLQLVNSRETRHVTGKSAQNDSSQRYLSK
jgi:hypothetical protein